MSTPKVAILLPKVGRLNTLSSVRREMRRVYRELRHGMMDAKAAGTHAYLLTSIAKVIEVEQLEQRLTALEDRSAAGGIQSPYPLLTGRNDGVIN